MEARAKQGHRMDRDVDGYQRRRERVRGRQADEMARQARRDRPKRGSPHNRKVARCGSRPRRLFVRSLWHLLLSLSRSEPLQPRPNTPRALVNEDSLFCLSRYRSPQCLKCTASQGGTAFRENRRIRSKQDLWNAALHRLIARPAYRAWLFPVAATRAETRVDAMLLRRDRWFQSHFR